MIKITHWTTKEEKLARQLRAEGLKIIQIADHPAFKGRRTCHAIANFLWYRDNRSKELFRRADAYQARKQAKYLAVQAGGDTPSLGVFHNAPEAA